MGEPCPHCGGTLPTSPARICTWCYARVEGLPPDTPFAPERVPQYWVVSVVTILLLWAGVTLLGRGLMWAVRGDPGDAAFDAGVGAAFLTGSMAVLRWGYRADNPPTA